jgi:hypothetical protein
MIRTFLITVKLFFAVTIVHAQHTGGVFPPVVNPDTHSLQYRISIDPNDAAGKTSITQRMHYLNALNDDLMLIVFTGLRQTQETDFDFDYVHAGLFFDLGEDGQKYRTGVRIDLRARDDNRPNHVVLNWMNQYSFDNGWRARLVLMSNIQFGDWARDGVFLQSRWQLAKRLDSRRSVGLEMFSFYGSTDKLGNFNSQSHSVGPTFSMSIAPKWSIFSGVLFGISERAADSHFRFWISRSL